MACSDQTTATIAVVGVLMIMLVASVTSVVMERQAAAAERANRPFRIEPDEDAMMRDIINDGVAAVRNVFTHGDEIEARLNPDWKPGAGDRMRDPLIAQRVAEKRRK